MRGTQSQDRAVSTPRDPKLLLRRYALIGGPALLLLAALIWSANTWLSSE